MTLEQIVAALDAAERKATKGPWRVDDESWMEMNDITVWCGPEGDDAECLCNMGMPISNCGAIEEAKVSFANGQFIVLARNHMRTLIEAVKINKRLVEFVKDSSCECYDDYGRLNPNLCERCKLLLEAGE